MRQTEFQRKDIKNKSTPVKVHPSILVHYELSWLSEKTNIFSPEMSEVENTALRNNVNVKDIKEATNSRLFHRPPALQPLSQSP